ncbi:MAG TPA: hypothetical protein VJ890_10995 [Vineibacter sp.]|nr:hypothetical protein [Vineibacter sp.]
MADEPKPAGAENFDPDALQESVDMGEMVRVRTAGGLEGFVPRAQVAAVEAAGGHAETPEEAAARAAAEEFDTPLEAAKTAGEGLAAGLTVGASDWALRETLGEEYRQGAQRRAETFGGLRTAAELTGAIAPVIASGGSSLAARGLALAGTPARAVAGAGRAAEALVGAGAKAIGLTGEGIAARGVLRGGQYAAAGLVEGGLMGAGHALSEEALSGGNYDALGEKMWAGAQRGMTVGAAIGGPLGFVGGAGARALERGTNALIGPKGLKSFLTRYGDEQLAKGLGATGRDMSNMGKTVSIREAELQAIAKEVREATLADGRKVFGAADDAEEIAEKLTIGRAEAGSKLDDFRVQISTVSAADPALAPDTLSMFTRIDAMDLAARVAPPALKAQVRRAIKQVAPLRRLDAQRRLTGDSLTIDELTTFRKQIDDLLFPPKIAKGLPPPPPPNAAQLMEVRRALEDTIEEATERAAAQLGGTMPGTYKALKNTYRRLSQAHDIATAASGRAAGKKGSSMGAILAGTAGAITSVATGSVVPAMIAAGMNVGRHLASERGHSTLAVLADRAARVDGRIARGVSAYIKRLSDVRRQGVGEAGSVEEDERTHAERTLGRRGKETLSDAYTRRATEIARFNAASLPDLERRIGTEMAGAAPQTTMAASATAVRGMTFLQSKIPAALQDTTLALPQLNKRQVSPLEAMRFARYVEVVDDPLTVLDAMATGRLSRQHVEALQAVYPHLYTDIRGRTWQAMAKAKDPPPYAERAFYGRLWDLPTSRSLSPSSILRTQRSFQPAEAPAAPSAPSPPRRSGGSTANSIASRVDQLESAELTV